ncbi:MAG: hypothetical protein HY369_04505 [Candidatus Aenigmarchaeota archaeon]|nr:hypothetical protein [Candidatus Aenigmarchaeota archaeon]
MADALTFEMIFAVVAIVGALFLFLFVSGQFGTFAALKDCPPEGEPIPVYMFWCRGGSASYDRIAADSMKALACAVNAAAQGACTDEACPGASKPTVTASFVAAAEPERRCYGASCVTCTGGFTVEDFELPQDVSKIDTWIPWFGMPQSLVYWQQFPLDEDTWSEEHDFSFYTVVSAFVLIGPTKGIKILQKLAAVKKVEGVSSAAIAAAKTTTIIKEGISATLANTLTKRGLTFTALRAAAGGAATFTYEAWETLRAQAVEDFLAAHPDQIVLLKALQGKDQTMSVVDELADKPVILQWSPEWTDDERALHFVSPCKIDRMVVESTTFGCQEFIADTTLGTVHCSTDTEGAYAEPPEDVPTCQEIGGPIDLPSIKNHLGPRPPRFDGDLISESPFRPLLEPAFNAINGGDLPNFPPQKRFFADGFFVVPINVAPCSKGTSCSRLDLLYADAEISVAKGSENRLTSSAKPRDYVLSQETYTNAQGQPTTEAVQVGFSQTDQTIFIQGPTVFSSDQEITYTSDDGTYALRFFSAVDDDEWGVVATLPQDGSLSTATGVHFVWQTQETDDLVTRGLNLGYASPGDVDIGVILRDDGGAEGIVSSFQASDRITIQKFPDIPGTVATYEDKDLDGTIDVRGFATFSLTGSTPACLSGGVVVKDFVPAEDYDPNYCVRETSTLAKIGEVAGWAGFVGSIFVGGWPGVLLGLTGLSGEAYAGHQQDWPNGGVG